VPSPRVARGTGSEVVQEAEPRACASKADPSDDAEAQDSRVASCAEPEPAPDLEPEAEWASEADTLTVPNPHPRASSSCASARTVPGRAVLCCAALPCRARHAALLCARLPLGRRPRWMQVASVGSFAEELGVHAREFVPDRDPAIEPSRVAAAAHPGELSSPRCARIAATG
jgi:hypothetical protein